MAVRINGRPVSPSVPNEVSAVLGQVFSVELTIPAGEYTIGDMIAVISSGIVWETREVEINGTHINRVGDAKLVFASQTGFVIEGDCMIEFKKVGSIRPLGRLLVHVTPRTINIPPPVPTFVTLEPEGPPAAPTVMVPAVAPPPPRQKTKTEKAINWGFVALGMIAAVAVVYFMVRVILMPGWALQETIETSKAAEAATATSTP